MSYSIIQQPSAILSLAQSPVIFSVSSSQFVGADNFQYIAELTIWNGSNSNSGSGDTWTLAKYPSSEGFTGIFDCSRIINSTQTNLALDFETYPQLENSLKKYKIESYYRYQSGSQYVTGSHIESDVFQAADGYQLFPMTINQSPLSQSIQPYNFWPLLTDGPVSQSCFDTNKGFGYVYKNYNNTFTTSSKVDKIRFTDSNGQVQYYQLDSGSYPNFPTTELVEPFPLYPSETGFPLTGSYDWYNVCAVNVDNEPLSETLSFVVVCEQKYPNIRIAFKNRWGVLQYINMDMINRKSFNTTRRTYQPQLGTFQARELTYNEWDSQTLNYITDSSQKIVCNTNWLDEWWNEIIKQLLVSDEIYWVYEGETPTYDSTSWTYKPLTISTQTLQFKTGVNDHLIQYAFEFDFGQGYKLII